MSRPRKLRPLPDADDLPPTLNSAEVAALLGISEEAVRQGAEREEIPCRFRKGKTGRRVFTYYRDEILAYRDGKPAEAGIDEATLGRLLEQAAARGAELALARLGLALAGERRTA